MKNKKKVAFLGTKEIGAQCFQYLLSQQDELAIEIPYVLTNSRSLSQNQNSVQQLAENAKIPVLSSLNDLVIQPSVDVLLSVQYHQILKQKHIDKARLAVNFHMAPLPEYRGCNQFSFAIIDGKKEFGTTAHLLTAGIDSGDIIEEIRFPIPSDIFVNELYELTFSKTIHLFKETLPKLIENSFKLTPQEQLETKRGCSYHFRNEIEALKKINLDWPLEKQKRYFRATFFPPFAPPVGVNSEDEFPLSMEWYKSLA